MGGAGDAGERRVHGVPVREVELDPAAAGAGAAAGEGEGWDATVLVTAPGVEPPAALRAAVEQAVRFDAALEKECGVAASPAAWGARLVLAPTGALTPYHDVRSVYEACGAGVARAVRAGARRPVVVLQAHARWPRAPLVALLAALEHLYVPLQMREEGREDALPALAALGVAAPAAESELRAALPALLRDAAALETARGLARDMGGGDPERMTPLASARLVRDALAPLRHVAVRVVHDAERLARDYPLLAAVSRAADAVPRHRGCVLLAEYAPPSYARTVMLVGKGVTYDTGGCDVKAGGAMAGMSRDKCGAAAAAGFVQACALLQADVRVVCALGLVRNSIGEEAYVADEVITSRGGRRVRVGNTDAEGRMVMADLLTEMRERAETEFAADRPHLYTVATLTGHAHRAVGEGYSIAIDNHAAAAAHHARKLQASGDSLADPFEVSTLRREDLKAHAGRARGDFLHQADNLPSSAMPRGHQGPAAFLLLAAGLDAGAVPYTHLDVAASAGALPAAPTAAPLLALAAHYGLVRSC